jgi:hypothetical protein
MNKKHNVLVFNKMSQINRKKFHLVKAITLGSRRKALRRPVSLAKVAAVAFEMRPEQR